MTTVPDLREVFEPPDELVQAGLDGQLVMFVGAGVSMLAGLPAWKELAELALEDLRKLSLLNFSEIEQLKSLDPKKQLSIAKLIAEENGYELGLQKHLMVTPPSGGIYDALNQVGCAFVTTNYDELLSPDVGAAADGSTTPMPVKRVSARSQLYSHLLDDPATVVHLHGAVSKPDTMIITTRDYLTHYDDENVQTFLTDLFSRKTVLFIGYGLEEAEILEHILRRGAAKHSDERRRFALQGFFRSQTPLYKKLHRYYEMSFGVHLLGFLRDHNDYNCQTGIIKDWALKLEVKKPPLAMAAALMDEVLGV